MKKILMAFGLLFLCGAVSAQTTSQPSYKVDLSWTMATNGCEIGPTTCVVHRLTGDNALTAVNVYISTAPIPNRPTAAPTLVLGPAAAATSYNVQVPTGTKTLYARVAGVNRHGVGTLSNEKIVTVPEPTAPAVRPGLPANVTFTITLVPAP